MQLDTRLGKFERVGRGCLVVVIEVRTREVIEEAQGSPRCSQLCLLI